MKDADGKPIRLGAWYSAVTVDMKYLCDVRVLKFATKTAAIPFDRVFVHDPNNTRDSRTHVVLASSLHRATTRKTYTQRIRERYATGTCPHCETEQPLDDSSRLVMPHSYPPTRMVCRGAGYSCVEDVQAAESEERT